MGTGAPTLSLLQEQFCLAYVRNGGDGTAAYAEVRPEVKRSSAKRYATKYLADPNVASRIAELRSEIVEESKITIEDMVREFATDRELARKEGLISASVKANESIAKLLGLWVDKTETTHTMRPEEARALIGQMAAKYLPAAQP